MSQNGISEARLAEIEARATRPCTTGLEDEHDDVKREVWEWTDQRIREDVLLLVAEVRRLSALEAAPDADV